MIKGYLRISQCSPKGGLISNRVRHLFIFLAWLYPLYPASIEILFPKQSVCWGLHGPLQQYFLLSMGAFLLEDSVVGGLISRYLGCFLSTVASGVVGMMSLINACLSSSGIWLLLGIFDFHHELLWRIRLYVELFSPVVTDDPSGSLLWLFLPCRISVPWYPSPQWIFFALWWLWFSLRMVDSWTYVLSMSVCQHSSYILGRMHTCIIIAFGY